MRFPALCGSTSQVEHEFNPMKGLCPFIHACLGETVET